MDKEYSSLDISRFLIASFFGFLGGHLTNYSVILFAQDVWNSDLYAGMGFALCFGVPLFLGWFAGAWCDSNSPAKLAQIAHFSFLASIGFLHFSSISEESFSRVLFLIGSGFAGIGWAILAPARMALLGRLAGKNQKSLAVVFNILVMLGFGAAPPILALSKKWGSWEYVHISGFFLFILSIVLLIGMKVPGFGKSGSALDRIKKGFGYAFGNPLLKQTLILAVIIYLSMGPVQVMLPRYATGILHLDEISRGLFLGTLALALLVGGGTSLLLAKKLGMGNTIFLSGFLSGSGILSLGLSRDIHLSILFLLISGLGAGMSISLLVAILQSESEPEFRGRLVSVYTVTSQVVPATSGLLSGIALTKFSVDVTLIGAGSIIGILLFLGLLKLSVLRSYRHT